MFFVRLKNNPVLELRIGPSVSWEKETKRYLGLQSTVFGGLARRSVVLGSNMTSWIPTIWVSRM